MKQSIVKSSDRIRKVLRERFKEIGLNFTNVSQEAKLLGVTIQVESLSRYFAGKDKSILSEEQIIWLCYRYCIPISLKIGIPETNTAYKIPVYSEVNGLKAIQLLTRNELHPTTTRSDERSPGRKGRISSKKESSPISGKETITIKTGSKRVKTWTDKA